MGIAAYNRGSEVIRESIDRDRAGRTDVDRAYESGYDRGTADAAAEVRSLEKQLDRARTALRLEAAKLVEERRRAAEVVERLEEIREDFRGKGASRAHYIAILALLRAKRVLGR